MCKSRLVFWSFFFSSTKCRLAWELAYCNRRQDKSFVVSFKIQPSVSAWTPAFNASTSSKARRAPLYTLVSNVSADVGTTGTRVICNAIFHGESRTKVSSVKISVK